MSIVREEKADIREKADQTSGGMHAQYIKARTVAQVTSGWGSERHHHHLKSKARAEPCIRSHVSQRTPSHTSHPCNSVYGMPARRPAEALAAHHQQPPPTPPPSAVTEHLWTPWTLGTLFAHPARLAPRGGLRLAARRWANTRANKGTLYPASSFARLRHSMFLLPNVAWNNNANGVCFWDRSLDVMEFHGTLLAPSLTT